MSGASSSLQMRIDVAKVTSLMDVVGELSLAVNAVVNNDELSGVQLEKFHLASHSLNLLVQEIQSGTANLSMVPLSTISSKMRKLIRDLNKQTNKEIELLIIGEDVEIDKSILDKLQDPLIHLVRNSADHGIKEKGCITITATQQGSEIHINVADDGQGLNKDVILQKAIEKNVISSDQGMNDSQIFRLILQPGFSTAEKVSNLSGRGVGMDVVNATIESLRGRLLINSIVGKGTTMTMQIPLSMAFLECFVVRLNKYMFAVPIDRIVEVLQPNDDSIVLSSQNDTESIIVREAVIPVRRLEKYFNGTDDVKPLNNMVMVIIKSSSKVYCIPVDEIVGQQQVTMKPSSGIIADVKGNSGCAILKNGEVALSLDCDKIGETIQ